MQVGRVFPFNFKSNFIEGNKYQKYQKDFEYIKSLAQAIGMDSSDILRLSSIIGEEEFCDILKKSDTINYIPPNVSRGRISGNMLNQLLKSQYGLNLHIHTTASDGNMSPVDLINQAALYADKLKEMGRDDTFTIAITDHDTMEGNKDVIWAVASNPEKYKNLKIVLGVELSAIYKDNLKMNVPTDYELIGYCINPYDKRSSEFLRNLRETRIQFSKFVIQDVAKYYPSYDFSYEDACDYTKNCQKGINGFLYTLANYFKSKAPFIDKYEFALKYLPQNTEYEPKIACKASDIADAFQDNSGFFGIAHPGRINLSDGKIKDEYIRECDYFGKNAGYQILDDFIKLLKDTFGARFKAIETNYQSYENDLAHANDIIQGQESYSDKYQGSINYLSYFKQIARQNSLFQTGGLDTHSENPFLKK